MPVYNCGRKTGPSNPSTILCLVKATISPTEMFTPGMSISYQVRYCTTTQTHWARELHRTAVEWCLTYGRHHISALSPLPALYTPSFWWRNCSSLQPAVAHFFLFWSQTSPNTKVPAACKTWGRSKTGEWPAHCYLTSPLSSWEVEGNKPFLHCSYQVSHGAHHPCVVKTHQRVFYNSIMYPLRGCIS